MERATKWRSDYPYYTLEEEQGFELDIYGKYYEDKYISLNCDGLLIVSPGYSWNGCSPKFIILDVVIGTPEGAKRGKYPKTYFASLVHDILYSLKVCTRKKADMIFLKMLRMYDFKLAFLYYLAVRLFGGKAWDKG